MLTLGIVGLPNVGKSTLFNALTNLSPYGGSPEGRQVLVANYPFATIEPNIGVVAVPDERLAVLSGLENSAEIVPAVVEFNDIAGLVAGAHKGEGLGNKFLSHIREVDAIVHVVRFFEDSDIIHVAEKIDPKWDIETIETELLLADLQTVEKKLEAAQSAARSGKTEDAARLAIAKKYFDALSAGKAAREVALTDEEKKLQHEFPLLTRKPTLFVANIKQGVAPAKAGAHFLDPRLREDDNLIALDAQLESEISQLAESERADYLKELGLAQSGLDKLIKAGYKLLDLITFFTAGPKETRAWTVRRGAKAPQAAGVIHTDFERGFIKAEVINWEKMRDMGGWNQTKERGLLRTEGKDYVIQDGDVVHFRFNV